MASNAVPLDDTERQASSVREESKGGEKGLDSDSFNCFCTSLGVLGLIFVALCTRQGVGVCSPTGALSANCGKGADNS